jgi:hypothetical protein
VLVSVESSDDGCWMVAGCWMVVGGGGGGKQSKFPRRGLEDGPFCPFMTQ